MSVWVRDITGRLPRVDQTPHINMEGQGVEGRNNLPFQVPNEAPVPQGRYMQDYLNPTRASTPSCIVLPTNAHTFTIKPGMLPSLSIFHGMESKSSYLHVKEFEEMVGTMFMSKSPEEAPDFFDELAENNQSWDFSYSVENSRQFLGSNTSGHGKYMLREPDDLQAKHGHSAAGCPTLPVFKEVLQGGDQRERARWDVVVDGGGGVVFVEEVVIVVGRHQFIIVIVVEEIVFFAVVFVEVFFADGGGGVVVVEVRLGGSGCRRLLCVACWDWLPCYLHWLLILVTSIAAQFADNLISNGVETTTVRKVCQSVTFLSPAICMILASLDLGLPPWEMVVILTSGLALSSFALSGLYCTHQDISPEYASVLLGITNYNTVGAVPGIVSVTFTGYLLDSTHSWSMSLFAPSVFFYRTGTIIWLAFANSKSQLFDGRVTWQRSTN
ncbi:phosphate transporter 4;5 [Actinidia rufa]|uniref:Phosphate transporter 45 n=1 Tax=Actinidia rufa TaxID=165716 RepID=A0A7J0E3I2_9ERIC|nr:phosphate transporter 4;5 [Actinidia rufa]